VPSAKARGKARFATMPTRTGWAGALIVSKQALPKDIFVSIRGRGDAARCRSPGRAPSHLCVKRIREVLRRHSSPPPPVRPSIRP